MKPEQLEAVRAWAEEKIATGAEPPWAWYQYMKLRETLDALLAGGGVTKPLGLPESEQRSEKHLRLVACIDQPNDAPRRPAGLPVRMPM